MKKVTLSCLSSVYAAWHLEPKWWRIRLAAPVGSGQGGSHMVSVPRFPQVLVWIHGGGLVMGMASMYDGSVLAAFEDVVVVTIQYRLGILGFFR